MFFSPLLALSYSLLDRTRVACLSVNMLVYVMILKASFAFALVSSLLVFSSGVKSRRVISLFYTIRGVLKNPDILRSG